MNLSRRVYMIWQGSHIAPEASTCGGRPYTALSTPLKAFNVLDCFTD